MAIVMIVTISKSSQRPLIADMIAQRHIESNSSAAAIKIPKLKRQAGHQSARCVGRQFVEMHRNDAPAPARPPASENAARIKTGNCRQTPGRNHHQ